MTTKTKDITGLLAAIVKERTRQDGLFGEQNHDPFTWLSILMEEVGEVAKAALDADYNVDELEGNYRDELVQVAAVAIAMIECLDRDKWHEEKP